MHSKTDTIQSSVEALRYPWENHPGPDEVVEVMPGVLWVRLTLPFRLNHVNIYLLADGDGWAMVDSGFGNEESIGAWTTLFEGPLKAEKISRLIVTHSHPDHVGLAGWITERFDCPLYMSQVEYLQSVYHQNRGTEERMNAQRLFFRPHGMDESLTGHGVPFYGMKTRIKQLADHHEDRCRLIADACREIPQTSKELVPVVFHKHVLDVHQMGFAAGELIAHVNYMLVEGRLTSEVTDGVLRFRTT